MTHLRQDPLTTAVCLAFRICAALGLEHTGGAPVSVHELTLPGIDEVSTEHPPLNHLTRILHSLLLSAEYPKETDLPLNS